jgi:Rrf2 family protein
MRVSARVDYAVCALVELARAPAGGRSVLQIAADSGIPQHFLQRVLEDLRGAGLVLGDGGRGQPRALAVSASALSLADVAQALDGPVGSVRGRPLEQLVYPPQLAEVAAAWGRLRAAIAPVLQETTIASLARLD